LVPAGTVAEALDLQIGDRPWRVDTPADWVTDVG